MYGATISTDTTRVTDVEIEASDPSNPGLACGEVNSDGAVIGGIPLADTIAGNVQNDGTISFGGAALHTLTISAATGGGAYTQSSSGTLSMRLSSSGNDTLAVGAAATLDGTLTLSGSSLPEGTWTIITYASESGDFDTFNWPDTDPGWLGTPGLAGYDVSN
jgi:hypothetical protein